MPSTIQLLTDTFRARHKEAIRSGKIDINRVKGEIARREGSSSREFIPVCQSIEDTGNAMVDDWIERANDARDDHYGRLILRKTAHDLIEDFIRQARTWRVVPMAFGGATTINSLTAEELGHVETRLKERFDDGQDRIALRPTTRTKTYWLGLSRKDWTILIVAAVLGLVGTVVGTLIT